MSRAPDRFRWLLAAAAALGLLAAASRLRQFAPRLAGFRHEDGLSGRGQPSTPPSAPARAAGHETEEMHAGLMAKLVLLLGGVAFAMIVAMAGLRLWVTQAQLDSYPPFTKLQTKPVDPPKPNLQAAPLAEIAQHDAREAAKLSGFAYRDAAKTRARIPIGDAMSLTLGAGLGPPP